MILEIVGGSVGCLNKVLDWKGKRISLIVKGIVEIARKAKVFANICCIYTIYCVKYAEKQTCLQC